MYGAVQNKIEEAFNFASKLDGRLKAEFSSRRDADLTEAILELQQAEVQQEATLQARAQLRNTSLFDFLR